MACYRVNLHLYFSASGGDDSDLALVLTKRGYTVDRTSQTPASVVLASTIVIVLPPFGFEFSKQITGNCILQNIVNTAKQSYWRCLYSINIPSGRVASRELKDIVIRVSHPYC